MLLELLILAKAIELLAKSVDRYFMPLKDGVELLMDPLHRIRNILINLLADLITKRSSDLLPACLPRRIFQRFLDNVKRLDLLAPVID